MKIETIKKLKHIILPNDDLINVGQDEQYANDFVLNLDKPYEFSSSTELQLKNSVSAILKESNGEQNFEREDFLSQPMYDDAVLESTKLGTLYHSAMQCYKLNQSDEDFLNAINQSFTDEEKQSLNMEKLLTAKKKMDTITKECKNIYQEQKFMMYVPHKDIFSDSTIEDKILIQGIVDIVVEYQDKLLVIDYKTNKTQNKEHLMNQYSKQLELYKMAIELSFKKPTQSCLYAFSIDDFIME